MVSYRDAATGPPKPSRPQHASGPQAWRPNPQTPHRAWPFGPGSDPPTPPTRQPIDVSTCPNISRTDPFLCLDTSLSYVLNQHTPPSANYSWQIFRLVADLGDLRHADPRQHTGGPDTPKRRAGLPHPRLDHQAGDRPKGPPKNPRRALLGDGPHVRLVPRQTQQ